MCERIESPSLRFSGVPARSPLPPWRAKVTDAARPPVEFRVKPGLVYFQVPAPVQDVYWKHAKKDGNLAVWLPPLLDQAQPIIKLLGTFGSRS